MERGNTKQMLEVMSRGGNGERKHKKNGGNEEQRWKRWDGTLGNW